MEKNIRYLLLFLIVIIIASCKAKSTQPNILFIFTDDQSYRTVSSYEGSYTWSKTPNIDQLASEGIRFTDAYCGPWCAPARAMIMTGKMLHAIDGLDFNQYPAISHQPEQFRMWPEVLRENNYTTALIGKWHLGAEYGHGRVWDHSIVWNHSEPEKAGGYYLDQKLRFDGGDFVAVGGYSTDNYTQYAKDFIKRDHKKPWMLWLCYDAIHAPFTPADRHNGIFKDALPIDIPQDVYPPRPTKPGYMQNYAMLNPDKDSIPIDKRSNVRLPDLIRKYHSASLSLDEGVGELIATLKATGQLDNTIIVFTSDQGLAMGHHGMTIKVAPYDDNIRAPLIIKLPGEAEGKVCEVPVQGIDLIPTLFEYLDIELPWKMDGKSLMPLIKNQKAEWKHPVVLENFSMKFGYETEIGITDEKPNQAVDWWISYREGKYKYIRTLREDEIEELYDLQSDPQELINLVYDPAFKSKLNDFRLALTNQLIKADAGLVENWPEPKIIN